MWRTSVGNPPPSRDQRDAALLIIPCDSQKVTHIVGLTGVEMSGEIENDILESTCNDEIESAPTGK